MDSITVLTFKSVERLLSEGGTSSWRLNRTEALKRRYAVCTRNRFDERCEGVEPHGSAFLIGKIADVVPAPGRDGRWLITFSEFAHLDIDDVWRGNRNPVSYTSLSDMGIDVEKLEFLSMPTASPMKNVAKSQPDEAETVAPLSIPEAKQRLAATFGVTPDRVEILIRG